MVEPGQQFAEEPTCDHSHQQQHNESSEHIFRDNFSGMHFLMF